MSNPVTVRVWGDFACFTRPEMKVERVSYPIMTPSAARGVLEAIFWEPQMYYLVDEIAVVKRGRWVSFRRNEVTAVISMDSAKAWRRSPEKFRPIEAGGGAADGTQRNMLALEQVEYLVTAEILLSALGRKTGQRIEKYSAEFERRARQGKCFHRPALGMREFAADFEWVEARDGVALADWPDEDLGIMLYDVFDPSARGEGFRWLTSDEIAASGEGTARHEGRILKPQAVFFNARVHNARMPCHPQKVKLITPKGGVDHAA
ncbi:MAG: type I-C CRISPR-associated protein Cas5 [Planctomycetes bacterium]|nr:type I-C CRISPR-associated protein Cas5 [Planctomycetota bacterium]